MAGDRFAHRREKLIRRLQKSETESLLVTSATNVSYLTGFSGDSSFLLIGPDRTRLISDRRYAIQIAEECPRIATYIREPSLQMWDAVAEIVEHMKLQQLGFESNHLAFADWETFTKKVPSIELTPREGLVEQIRLIKDGHEIGEIGKAIRQAEQAFAYLRASPLGRMTELEAAHDLEHAMRRFGAGKASFEPIIAVGPRSALPHARPTNGLISDGDFLLVDWGATTREGYKSDLTRFLVTGKISPKLKSVYRVVLTAQLRAIEAVRPGARCKDVDAVARRTIAKAGYGKHFGHGLGHGIGLEIHEGPRLRPTSTDILRPGMVVTIEPGIYLPGWGGIRIEDDVLVTRTGCKVMTSVPKEFHEVVAN